MKGTTLKTKLCLLYIKQFLGKIASGNQIVC